MTTTATSLLRKAAAQFRYYEQAHLDKIGAQFELGTPKADDTMDKAAANAKHATEIEEFLADMPVALEHAYMVATLQKTGKEILLQMTPLKIACLHMAGGAASEGGELFDAIKRWALFGKDLDITNVIEELGDLEFFMEGLRQNLCIPRDATLEANLNKLVKGDRPRYAGGVFSDAATIARADKQPTEHEEMAAKMEATIAARDDGPEGPRKNLIAERDA